MGLVGGFINQGSFWGYLENCHGIWVPIFWRPPFRVGGLGLRVYG